MAKAGMSFGKITGALLLTLTVVSLSWGQMPDIPDKGFRPFGSYQLSDIDSVNLTNGNLVLHIPIVSYPQRGDVPPLSLSVRFNNPRWLEKFVYHGQEDWGGQIWAAVWGDDGMGLEIVRDNTYSLAGYVYNHYGINPGGSSQSLHVVDSMGAHHIVESTSTTDLTPYGPMESIDGTGLALQNGSIVIDGNGVRHKVFETDTDHPTTPGNDGNEERWSYAISTDNGFEESTEDTNGNKITPQFAPSPSQQIGNTGYGGLVLGWTDTMGRFIPAPMEVGPSATPCETVNFPGTNGGVAPIRFCYISSYTNGQPAFRSSFGLPNVADGNYHDNELYPKFPAISSITLPNGTSWQFQYNNYGFLTSITLPTGGTISYGWQVSPQCAGFLQAMRNQGGGNLYGGPASNPEVCEFIITSRTFNANDGSASQTWTYSGDTVGSSQVTVTDPLGNDTVHTFSGAFDNASYETKTQYFSGPQANNQLLKTIDRQYQNINPPAWPACVTDEATADGMPRLPALVPQSTTTTWAATNQVSQTTFTYDSGASVYLSNWGKIQSCPLVYGKVIQESEYGYGTDTPGALLRTTNTQYQAFHDGNYLANNLLNLPYSVQVTDGGGNQVGYSYHEYDQTGLQPSGVSTQLDANPPGAHYRGNLTTAHRWLNTNGTYLNTTTSYYDTGMPYQATDAKGNTTTFSYDSAGAYITKVQMPTTSNGVQHITYASYDFNTGLTTSSTDQNQQTTNYTYDNMGRVKSVTGPPDPNNGGQSSQTIYNYYDLPNVSLPEVEVRQNIDGRQTSSLTLFDGLGRPTRAATWNDEGNATDQNYYDQVDTCFDGLGQRYFTSHPYRSTGFNTTKTCSNSLEPGDTFTYDALGRVTNVTNADGGIVSTDYSQFPAVTVTDQAGNQRRNRTDALGRLLEVDEPGGSPASAASGSLAINGTLQSFNAGPQQATSGHVELTFSGTLQSKSSCSPSGQPCSDNGSISITVAGSTKSVSYPYPGYMGADSGGSIQALANAFHTDTTSPVDAIYYGADESGNIVMDFVARAKGAATNYPLSTAIASNDPTDFPSPSFQVSAGSHLIGGQDASGPATSGHASLSFNGVLESKANCSASGGQPCTDSGSITASVTTAAGAFTKSAAYSSATGNNASQAVQALAGAFHADANSPVDAFFTTDESGSFILYLTARATGVATNYPLSTSIVSNDPGDFPSPSFQVSAPSSLAGGQAATNGGTIYDSGVVYASIGGFTASAPFGQSNNNTAAMIASALAGATGLNQPGSPVTATASGSTITLNYKTSGAAGNVSVGVSTSSYNPDTPSFTSSGATLSGGSNPQPLLLSTPAVTLYSYDALGNMLCVEQHGNVSGTGCSSPASSDATSAWRVRRFAYDSLSRLLTATNPESGIINYAYDANGNLVQKISPAPNQAGTATVITSYNYDELNRLTDKLSSDSHEAGYIYDLAQLWGVAVQNPIGRLVGASAAPPISTPSGASLGSAPPPPPPPPPPPQPAPGNVVWRSVSSYDVMGRLTYQNQLSQFGSPAVSEVFNYAYNLDGSLKSITYPSGRVVTYTYNLAQRPTSAVDSNGINFAGNAHYTAWGAPSTESNGGMTTTNTYNLRMQPYELKTAAGNQPLLDLVYDFSSCNGNGANNGNVCQLINEKDSSRTQQFGYDALNRLLWGYTPNLNSGGYHNWWQGFTYDNWGNLLAKNVAGGDTPLNKTVTGRNQVDSWCYDAAGNIVGPNNPCSTYANNHTAYENIFDGENRLTQTTTGAGTTSYGYDADGQRVRKYNGSTGTLYWQGAGGEVLEETDLNGALTNEYIFFGGKRTARYSATNGYSFYFSDHLGSADVVTDALGNIKEESDYYPFGGERIVTDLGIGNNYKFTGKERDPETGCDYFGARYYCNPIGRFITPDWAASPTAVPYAHFGNPQSLNLYSYVKNNPTTFGDPDGHTPAVLTWTIELIVGGAEVVAAVDSAAMAAVTYAVTRPTSPSTSFGGNMGTIGMSETMLEAQAQGQQTRAIQNANNSSQGGQQQGTQQQGSGSKQGSGSAQPTGNGNKGTSGGDRAGKPFTPKVKAGAKADSAAAHGGQTTCEGCGQPTVPGQQSKAGVTPPGNETQVDHIIPKAQNGDGSPSNAQILCRTCNLEKSDKMPH